MHIFTGCGMRGSIVALLLVLSQMCVWEHSCQVLWSQDSERPTAIYDPNRAHLWNRLHSVIFIRSDIPSTADVPDALDPPLWGNSRHLLARPSHDRILRILDEFLQTHGERLIQDPVKRAILQRDLWAVFDWSVEREPEHVGEPAYDKEKQELQLSLVEVMRRLALTSAEIHALPSNYARAVASGQFAKEYDPQHPERPFLPPDLLDPHGPWVGIGGNSPSGEPAATGHTHAFSRSTFLVLMRLPEGRKATFDYLKALWDFPQPWIERKDDPRHEQTSENPNLPQFPSGTQVALVRQMMLFDNRGTLTSTPITESIQFRVYRDIAAKDRVNGESASSLLEAVQNSGQNFYQIRLSRPQLFANNAGGLRATALDEREFAMFNAFGPDEGSPGQHVPLSAYNPVLQMCFECHRGAGINSLNSRSALLKPNWLQHDYPAGAYDPANPWWEYGNTDWKQKRYEWGLLNGYRNAGATR
jgi:hypothetical protein